MRVILFLAAALFAAAPAFGQATRPAADQNASNWDVFQRLYPPRAIKAREQGVVGFRVSIDAKGAVTDCQVIQSSGHPLLDQETCKLITLNAEFAPESGLSGSQVRTRDGVITWKLPNSGAVLNVPQATAAGSSPEKVVCKKFVRTGTVASAERTCMTEREWARQSDDGKSTWQDAQGQGFTHGN